MSGNHGTAKPCSLYHWAAVSPWGVPTRLHTSWRPSSLSHIHPAADTRTKVENIPNERDYNREMKGALIPCVILQPPNHCNSIQLMNRGLVLVSLTFICVSWWTELLAPADIFYPWYFPSNQGWVCFLIPFTFIVKGNNYTWWYCTIPLDSLLLLISGEKKQNKWKHLPSSKSELLLQYWMLGMILGSFVGGITPSWVAQKWGISQKQQRNSGVWKFLKKVKG